MSLNGAENGRAVPKIFRPPMGYTLRWFSIPKSGNSARFVLRNERGEQLGVFRMPEERIKLENLLKDHLTLKQVIGRTREETTVVIEFCDSEGREIGTWDIKKEPCSPIEEMIKDLANR